MVKKTSPKSDPNTNSNNTTLLNKIKSTKTDLKKSQTEIKKLNKELDLLKKKVNEFEKDKELLSKNYNNIAKWKKQFETIEKVLNDNDNNKETDEKKIKNNIPFILMDLMKSINELHAFNLNLVNSVSKKRKRSISDYDSDDYSGESDYEEELDEDDLEIINEGKKNILDKGKREETKEKDKIKTEIKDILFYYRLNTKQLDNENTEILNQYLELLIVKEKVKQLNKKDLLYFIDLPIEKKINIYNQELDIHNLIDNSVPPRYKIINSCLPIMIKNKCLTKLSTFKTLDPGSGEYHKISSWINGLLDIPWNTFKELPVCKEKNSSDEIYKFLESGMNKLNDCVYGQYKTKQHMIQLVSKIISNPKSIGNVFSIYGPMGTGKTTIIKEGLSKLLGLPFVFISLGGASDSSFLDGHSYTYEGSLPGRIVESLKMAKCMNPIFYFDELDKVSDTSRGLEIINLLIHLTDPAQNSHFQDKYYGDIPFDLSKALFVFSFNNINQVNPILRDRMNLINVSGFQDDDKFNITKDFLIPSILKEYLIKNNEIEFTDNTIKYIVNKKEGKEEGVRSIKKRLETIISNLNVIKIAFIKNTQSRPTKKAKKGKSKNTDSKKSEIQELDVELIKKILPDIKSRTKSINFNILKNLKIPILVSEEIADLFLNNQLDVLDKPPFGMYT